MSPSMATDRIRLVIQTGEDVRSALRLEAARQGVEMSELADSILREALSGALSEIHQRQQRDQKKR